MEFQNERMVRKFQNIALGDGISKVIVLDQESFLQDLHGIFRAIKVVLAFNLKNFSESSLSKNILKLE